MSSTVLSCVLVGDDDTHILNTLTRILVGDPCWCVCVCVCLMLQLCKTYFRSQQQQQQQQLYGSENTQARSKNGASKHTHTHSRAPNKKCRKTPREPALESSAHWLPPASCTDKTCTRRVFSDVCGCPISEYGHRFARLAKCISVGLSAACCMPVRILIRCQFIAHTLIIINTIRAICNEKVQCHRGGPKTYTHTVLLCVAFESR